MNGHKARSRKFPAFVAMLGALLLSSGFALMAGVGGAGAADECVPQDAVPASYTDWVDDGEVIPTEENVAPAADTETVRYVAAGMTDPVIVEPATLGFWSNFEPNVTQGTYVGPPTWPTDADGSWSESKVNGGPQQDAEGVFQNGQGNGSWFYREQPKDAVTDVDHLWQKQVRELVPGSPAVTCEDVEPPVVEPPNDEPTDGEVAGPKAPTKAPKATTPKATTPKATTPKATTPKATTPQATSEVAGPKVPTAVDAGLPGAGADVTAQGLSLALTGGLLLLAAGFALTRKQAGDVDA